MTHVDITTGSRLHFGLLCGPPDGNWHYGGLGLMLNQPVWRIHVSLIVDSEKDVIDTSPAIAERAVRLLSEFRQLHPQLPPVHITTRNEVEPHAGLGSGTQLTLSLAAAFVLLSGERRPSSIATLASKLGRSQRSAVGTHGFDHGGFLVDHGRTENEIRRIVFPEDWRMVLLTPTTSQGMSGSTEEAFFSQREFLAPAMLDEFDTLINHNILPAIKERNLPNFRTALAKYGEMAGRFFAAAQGGIFSNESIRHVTQELLQKGISGAVQSSWGPTVCIPAATAAEAIDIQRAVFEITSKDHMRVTIAEPRNTGASIRTVASEDHIQRSFG